MNGKTEKLYRAVMITVRSLIPGFDPIFAMADFEQASRNALSAVFPSVAIIGCWFHFTKAVFEKVKSSVYRMCIRRIKYLVCGFVS